MALFIDEHLLAEIRWKLETFAWARGLFGRLKRNVKNPRINRSLKNKITGLSSNVIWMEGQVARDMGLIHAISGDESHLPKLKELLAKTFHVNQPGTPISGTDSWSYGMFHAGYFWAYDLVGNHRMFAGASGKALEKRFIEILAEQKKAVGRIKKFRNTEFWIVCTVGILGFLLGDKSAVDEAIDGPLGFKRALLEVCDGLHWPEATVYAHNYTSCCLTMLAEASLRNGGEDLYRYSTPNGVSLKSIYDGYVRFLFSEGRVATCGDNSTSAEVVARRDMKGGHDNYDMFLFNNRTYRETNRYEIIYRAYRDPVHAWLVSKSPGRDSWDHTFWGYSGLTHGTPLGEKRPPPAVSMVFPEYGAAIVRSRESDDYWESGLPAIFVRNGNLQDHGHKDAFAFTLNAFGKNIYPDFYIQWDYSKGLYTKGYKANPTPFSKKTVAHNTVVVDMKDAPRNGVSMSDVIRQGAMKILRMEGVVYPGVKQTRILGLTERYLVDVFSCESDRYCVFDYVLRSYGGLSCRGTGMMMPCRGLNEEYGLKEIDTSSRATDNTWLRDGRHAAIDGDWEATFQDDDGTGARLFVKGCSGTDVIRTSGPHYVSAFGWDTMPADGIVRKTPVLMIRRRSRKTRFVVVHQPFSEESKTERLRVVFTGRHVLIRGRSFVDTIDCSNMSTRRAGPAQSFGRRTCSQAPVEGAGNKCK